MKKNYASLLLLAASLFFYANSFSQNYTWVKGPNTSGLASTYGTQGVAAPANNPGGRHGCATWTDAAGNMWLFGGEGFASNTNLCWLNDLWKYDPVTNQWTWMRGSNGPNAVGAYGVQGVAAAGNDPGAREFSMYWTDAAGNFWLYGGEGYASAPQLGQLGDLWKYDPLTNQWTWMKGPNTTDMNGVYGTQNVSSAANFPGGRGRSGSWIDNTGKFWLFGGLGFAASSQGFLNDLWRYDPAINEWTWVSGSNAAATPGNYGSLGIPAASNVPGGRTFPSFWNDAAGNLVMFGGRGLAANASAGVMNDLWKYDLATGNWTWMNGQNVIDPAGIYGSLGVPAAANGPGGRESGAGWKDGMGNYWLFGGFGIDMQANSNRLNDLWKYNPATNQWSWIKGANTIDQNGTYGTLGLAAPANMPGARYYNTWWKATATNDLWLFGGLGFDAASNSAENMNDLWRFKVPCNPDSINASFSVLCGSGTTTLTALNTIPSQVSWYTSPVGGTALGSGSVLTTPVLSVAATPSVFTYYAEANSCTLTPRTMITITVNPSPQLSVSGPTAACIGQSVTLTLSGGSSYTLVTSLIPPFSFVVFTSTVSVGNTGTLMLFGENSYGCTTMDLHSLLPLPSPAVMASSSQPGILCVNATATLTAFGANTYSWSVSQATSTSVIISPSATSDYTVWGTNTQGCTASFTMTQLVSTCIGIEEPNNAGSAYAIYPNPSAGAFNFALRKAAQLQVLSQLGQVVLETELPAGDTRLETTLAKGIYLYRLVFADNSTGKGKLMID